MAHRINVMLNDSVWKILQKIPRGGRSKVINEAVLSTVKSQQRAAAIKRMDSIAKLLPPVSLETVIDLLRKDRQRVR